MTEYKLEDGLRAVSKNILLKVVGMITIILLAISINSFFSIKNGFDIIEPLFYLFLSVPFSLIYVAISIIRRKNLGLIDKSVLFFLIALNLFIWVLLSGK